MADQKESQTKSNGITGHISNGGTKSSSAHINAWEAPGPTAFDFRSDTVTSPTTSMLAATSSCTLLDDVFAEDPTTNSLEAYIAEMTGKEAALFVISGTMGNQLSIRTALGGPPHSVIADSRSHIIVWESGGIASISGAMPIPVLPSNTHHLTLPDIKKHAITTLDVHHAPTRLIALENTLNGTILPLSTCRSIARWARAQQPPIWLHLDGARLWEAVAAGAGSLREYSDCFDSVTMCFSKGLGAPVGSVIVGEGAFVRKARHLRRMMGGGLRQAGVVTAAARVAVEETFLGGRLTETHRRARLVAGMWEERGGKLGAEVETNMVWLDLDAAGISRERLVEAGVREEVKLLGGRVVVHYQICDDAVERLGRVMDAVLAHRPKELGNGVGDIDRVKEEAEEVMEPEME